MYFIFKNFIVIIKDYMIILKINENYNNQRTKSLYVISNYL